VDAGARGFKIHPNMDGLAADNPAYRAMFEVAQARKLFVILHTGAFAAVGYRTMQPADPEPYATLFADFPAVRVCLAHMNRDEPRRAWELMQAHEQLYADTSWQPAGVIGEAIEQVGVDRLLLGSDWPLLHPELQADALNELRQAVSSEDQLERIGNKNAIEFLGER
jgi:predicted TIM-barrel fold metal-dependent hydrolase